MEEVRSKANEASRKIRRETGYILIPKGGVLRKLRSLQLALPLCTITAGLTKKRNSMPFVNALVLEARALIPSVLLLFIISLLSLILVPPAYAQQVRQLGLVVIADDTSHVIETHDLFEGRVFSSFGTGFDANDALAVGDLNGDGVEDIVIAEDDGGVIDVFNVSGGQVKLGNNTAERFCTAFDKNDAFAVGDVDGDGMDEIIVAEDDGGMIDIYEQDQIFVAQPDPRCIRLRGMRTIRSTPFDQNDALAVGDVGGFSADVIVIAEDNRGVIDIFDLFGQRIGGPFRTGFDANDALVVGDVDGDGVEDIVIAEDDGGVIDILNRFGQTSFSSFRTDFDANDALAVGDVDGDGVEDIVIAEDDGGVVSIFNHLGQRIDGPFTIPFDRNDALAVLQAQELENFFLTTADTPVCNTRKITINVPFGDITLPLPIISEATGIWQDIVQNRLGVEGWNPEHHFIDKFPVKKDIPGPDNINNWWPLDNYKHVLCGELDHFQFYIPEGKAVTFAGAREEMDWNNFYRPQGPFAYILEQPKAVHFHQSTECNFSKSVEWHYCTNRMHQITPGLANCMEAEITPDESYFENVLNSKGNATPGRGGGSSFLTGHQLCTYGPWVREKCHDNRPEIHPSELYWWVEQDPTGFFRFFLMQLQDDSNRFDRSGDYAEEPGPPFRPWTKPPLAAEFRVAFELDPAAEPLNFDIFSQDALRVVTNKDPSFSQDADDGTQHAIEYDGKVVLSVTEHQPDGDLGIGFLGVCRNEANTRLQGYITIRSKVGVNDRGGEGIHTVRVETNKLPYFSSTQATTPPVIDREGPIKKVLLVVNAILDSLRRFLPFQSQNAQQNTTEIQLVADLQVQIIGDPEVNPDDLIISRVTLISEDEMRELTFESNPDGIGGIVKDVPVSESAALRFIMESGSVETAAVNGFALSPLFFQEEPILSESADSSIWPELASIAGSLQETAEPPANIEHVQKWQLDIAPSYAPFREGQVSPGEESPFAEEINEAISENDADRLQEIFGTDQPFEIVWSFQATNLSANTPVPVVVDVSAEPTEVQVQLLDDTIPNGRIEVTFPEQPEDEIYEFEATAAITDTNGFTNIVRRRFWSHVISGQSKQLEENILPAAAELASEPADDVVSASTSDMSGSPLDEVDIPEDLIAKIREARIVDLATADFAEDEQISIGELRHLIRGARTFTPNDPTCLGVPATIVGSDDPDQLMGTATDDVIIGGGGNDVIMGMGGDDIICGNDGNDNIESGPGEDRADGGPGSDNLFGGPDSDQLGGGPGEDGIFGASGFDILIGDLGFDTIGGGQGNDIVEGGAGSDELFAGPGADNIQGNGGDDMIDGGDGDDFINGGIGDDTCMNDVTIFCQ